MNEVAFLLAILVHKQVLTSAEAEKLQKSLTIGALSSSLPDMFYRVNKALSTREASIEKVDAREFLGKL